MDGLRLKKNPAIFAIVMTAFTINAVSTTFKEPLAWLLLLLFWIEMSWPLGPGGALVYQL